MMRVLRVCSICKARKKGCDKLLPSCTYCFKRGFICSYDDDHGPGLPPYKGSTPDTDLSIPQPPWFFDGKVVNDKSALLLQLSPLSALTFTGDLSTVNQILSQQVRHIFQLVQLTPCEAGRRFVKNFQNWLPIVAPEQLKETIHLAEREMPAADVSVLLLSICLVTMHPHIELLGGIMRPTALYMVVRMFYTQVQTVFQASAALVQAGLIISAYEYASGRLDSAHISIGACARMAQIVGIYEPVTNKDLLVGTAPWSKEIGRRNLWWAIIILERFILLEVSPGRYQHPGAKFPSRDVPLLSSAERTGGSVEFSDTPISFTRNKSQSVKFECQIEAIHMLERTLRIINVPTTPERRLWELKKLDVELQNTLMQLMEEQQESQCGAIGTVIRSLYLLHQDILSQALLLSPAANPQQWLQNSEAALDTATMIMVDVAKHHLSHVSHHGADSLVLCCASNVQVAIRHIQRRCSSSCDRADRLLKGLETLTALERAFCNRWGWP
ncbi:hypothetical protein F5884DRAFT_789231 [Xylogone sp. PMI_703]|nr:hypothetical protein F5884DRAFT_789231 [Xylogone sp. PMI_703]